MASSSQPAAASAANNAHGNYINGSTEEDRFAWKQCIPMGMRFRPTTIELINYYLTYKVLNVEFHDGIIADCNVYDYEPDELKGHAFEHDDGNMYFFAKVERKDNSEKKMNRVLSNNKGYWKATQARIFYGHNGVVVGDPGNSASVRVLGSKQLLNYHRFTYQSLKNGKRKDEKQDWLMHEYRLPNGLAVGTDGKELVLCVIYKHSRKNS